MAPGQGHERAEIDDHAGRHPGARPTLAQNRHCSRWPFAAYPNFSELCEAWRYSLRISLTLLSEIDRPNRMQDRDKTSHSNAVVVLSAVVARCFPSTAERDLTIAAIGRRPATTPLTGAALDEVAYRCPRYSGRNPMRDPSLSHMRSCFSWHGGTFSPSRRHARSPRQWFTFAPHGIATPQPGDSDNCYTAGPER